MIKDGVSTFSVTISAIPAFAATIAVLSPANLNINKGQNFNVSVSVNPQGTNNYAEKLVVNYPADILEETSFSFGSAWIALTQPGYDTVDNSNGILIKTAGYPGGISSSIPFGTISFHAKKAGNGNIRIGNNSLAFEVSSQSAITGNEASFVVNSLAPENTKVVPTVTSKKDTKTNNISSTTQSATEQNTQVTKENVASPQVAAVNVTIPSKNSSIWIWIILGVILVVAGAVYLTYLFF